MARGETLKFYCRPITLDDKLAKDGIEAVATLTEKEPYYLVGGLAVQSYLPTMCRRPTSDLDFSIVRPMNYADFKSLSKPVNEYLRDKGYNISERKHSRAFKLEIIDKSDHKNRFLIEFSRRNEKSFENSRKKLERELENAKSKILEERNTLYYVASPEDIIIPKLARSINTLIRNKDMTVNVPGIKLSLSEEKIKEKLDFIAELRQEAMMSPGDLELSEELRLISDIYDIRLLAEIAGYNPAYFKKACEDWNTILEKTPQRDLFSVAVLPNFTDNL